MLVATLRNAILHAKGSYRGQSTRQYLTHLARNTVLHDKAYALGQRTRATDNLR